MVSKGIKIKEFPIKQLAKAFLFCFILFVLKPNQKDLADFVLCTNLWV
ncbi:MAG: hypothetical protein ACJAUR_000122 [Ulvibacter sp.]|jgi:hypothetical protein